MKRSIPEQIENGIALAGQISLHATGRNPPSGVRMGRGSIVHNGDASCCYTNGVAVMP